MDVIIYDDQELLILKRQVLTLESELNYSYNELAEIEKTINNFSNKHNQELGEVLKNLLKFRKEKLEVEKDLNKKKQKDFEEAKAEYESLMKIMSF